MHRRQGMMGLLVLAALVLLAGCSGTASAQAGSATATPVPPPVDDTVLAEAVIEPLHWIELRFDVPGQVAEVLVSPGESVPAGAAIVRLDTSELELSWQSAQQDVVAQQAALDRLVHGASAELVDRAARENAQQVAQAEITLQVKQTQLEKARTEDPAAKVAAAETGVKQLELQMARVRAQDPAPDVTAAQVEMERAQIALDETQDEYNKALDRPWEPQKVRDGWARELKQAELSYQLAQAQLTRALNAANAHRINLEELAVQVADAREQVAQAVAAREAYTLTLNTLAAEVQAASLELEALRAWENPYLDKAAEEEIAQAETRLRQAEIAVAKLERQIANAELRAPFAGTVVDVPAKVGARVGQGEIVAVLATLDHFCAQTIDLTELDIAQVAEGKQVTVTVDALPEREFTGVVQELALRSGDYRGDVVYRVTVDLGEAEGAEMLRWGMTAMVKIGTD